MRLLIYLFLALFLFASCKKENPEDINFTNTLENNILIEMFESLDSLERNFYLRCKTAETFPCYNYTIKTNSSKSVNSISIRFEEIIKYDMCATAIGPARHTINLGQLSNGIYDLNITVGQLKTLGKLIVTSTNYEVKLNNPKQVEFTTTILNRVPKNTIWGLIGYHEEETDTLIQDFMASLIQIGAIQQPFKPGNYNYFTIDETGQMETPANHGYWFAKPFILRYFGSTQDLKDVLLKYKPYYINTILIRVNTDKGEEFINN